MKRIILLQFVFYSLGVMAQNVGIGIASPQARLHIQQTSGEVLRLQSSDPYISFFDNNGNYNGFIWLNKLFGNDFRIATPAASNVPIAIVPNNQLTLFAAANGNVGIATTVPGAKLDIAGANSWDLVNGEGDFRVGNGSYRLKMGVALGGGGAGASGIMQAGGIGSLSLGAGAKYLLQLNGPAGAIDLLNNTGGLRINGNAGTTGQVLTSNGVAAPQWKSLGELQGAQSAVILGYQDFSISNNTPQSSNPINVSIPDNADMLVWLKINLAKSCVIGPCHSGLQMKVFLDGGAIGTYDVHAVVMPDMLATHLTIGPMVVNNAPGNHILSYQVTSRYGNPYTILVNPIWTIFHK